MKKLTKALAASAIIAGAVFAAPVAANAATYVPPTTPVVSGGGSVAPGGAATIHYGAGTFTADGAVSVAIALPGNAVATGSVTPAAFLAATSAINGTAGHTGAATLTVDLPADVTGNVQVTATDVATGRTVSSVIKVAAAPGAASLTAADPNLARTGTYISLATVWGAVGLVAVGAGFIAIRTTARRKKAAAHTA
ncbi:hypothetical protein [Gryllotalpicola koreensis]|uniref:Sortase n=1 Tax=Gryllotalpicola koreensis TaxID=993086 RepID=A0ABP8A0F7_9MICO